MTRLAITALATCCALAACAPALAAAPKFRVQQFSWEAALTYAEANPAAEPASIQGERGETHSSARYRGSRSRADTVRIRRRRSVFSAPAPYSLETEATWREDGLERSCSERSTPDGAGSVTFRARRKRVLADWDLPFAITNCGPGAFDERALGGSLGSGLTQVIARRRFRDRSVRLAIRGSAPLRSEQSAVAGRLDWQASLRLVRVRRSR